LIIRLIESVLNLGLNEEIVTRLAHYPGASRRFALEVYARFLRDFGVVVMNADSILYDAVRDGLKKNEGVAKTRQLSTRALRIMIDTYKSIAEPPDDPYEQLQLAIEAMYMSYQSEA
jgi:pyruvate, orthophosphate dikinase